MTTIKYTNPRSVTAVHVEDSAPHNPYATGYGAQIPMPYRLTFTDGRTRRVYAVCYGNAASLYVRIDGETRYLDTDTEYALQDARDARTEG